MRTFRRVSVMGQPQQQQNSGNNRGRQLWLVLTLLCLSFIVYTFSSSSRAKSNMRLTARSLVPHTLVLVPGHGIYTKGRWHVAGWLNRFVPDIEKQIKVALTEYEPNNHLVMFGGGMTNAEAGWISEGQSYKDWALTHKIPNAYKAKSEDFARDSFENILFGICRFKEITGSYPEKFVVVGFEFKRERFVNEHRRAIKFPKDKFEYRGVPDSDLESIQEQIEMERAGTIKQFQQDPYGCEPPLSTKRVERNPFKRDHPYDLICPEMAELFKSCGPNIYHGHLPWSR